MTWMAIVAVAGVTAVIGLLFVVLAPWITRIGKRRRGPSDRR
ncbi:MAG: hypothetical protein ACP5KN_11820 [Armatimonadota bacterium]